MGEIVTLASSELMLAAQSGVIRRTAAIARHLTDMDFPVEFPWENDVVGAQAELAVAKFLNLYWTGVRSDHHADVGNMVEVRSITSPHKRLLLRPRDKSELPFVSVYAKDDRFDLRGWLFGSEVKVEKNRQQPNGGSECWLAEIADLHPMNRLKPWVEEQRKPLKT